MKQDNKEMVAKQEKNIPMATQTILPTRQSVHKQKAETSDLAKMEAQDQEEDIWVRHLYSEM